MTADHIPPKRIFPEAKVDAQAAKHVPSSPQTESAAYKLAFQDIDFLLRPDLRPVRFQLELLKPELLMNEANIGSTFVFYGSARNSRAVEGRCLARCRPDGLAAQGRRALKGQIALL
jgi:hypothetical protein